MCAQIASAVACALARHERGFGCLNDAISACLVLCGVVTYHYQRPAARQAAISTLWAAAKHQWVSGQLISIQHGLRSHP